MTTIWILVYSFRIRRCYDVLTKAGFKLIREFKVGDDGVDGFEQTYEYAGVSIDVFSFIKMKMEHIVIAFLRLRVKTKIFLCCK